MGGEESWVYLNISLDFTEPEILCRHSEVGMDSGPVAVELIVGDFGELVEVKGEFYARLNIGRGLICEFGMRELVTDFLECHFVNDML